MPQSIRALLRGCLAVLALSHAAWAQKLPFQTFDWFPTQDPQLQTLIEKDLRLDRNLLPRVSSSQGVMTVENPGGAPQAGVFARVNLDKGSWTVHYRLRVLGNDSPAPVGVGVATVRWEGKVGSQWQSGALTAGVAGLLGPSSLSFIMSSRQGSLQLSDIEFVHLPFEARVFANGGDQLTLQLQGRVPEGLISEFRIVPMDRWQDPEGAPSLVRTEPGPFELPAGAAREPALVRWRIVNPAGEVVHSGGELRIGPPDPPHLGTRRRDVGLDSAGFMRRDGQRFLPLGLYCQPDRLSQCAEMGLNLAILGDGPTIPQRLNEARQLGLEVILGTSAPSPQAVQPLIDKFGQGPIAAWALIDEPEDKRETSASLASLRDTLYQADSRPLYQSIHNANRLGPFLRWADITAIDTYPIATIPRPLATVGAQLDKARALISPGKALWYINQAFAEAPFWKRPPTPAELHAMTWLAFNHGARGLIFYSQDEIRAPGFPNYRWDLSKTDLAPEIKSETRELRSLQNYLLDGRGPIALSSSSRPLPAISQGDDGAWDAAIYPGADSSLVVVVNLDDHASSGSLTIPAGFTQIVEFPGGQPGPASQVLNLQMPPYGIKLFLLNSSPQT